MSSLSSSLERYALALTLFSQAVEPLNPVGELLDELFAVNTVPASKAAWVDFHSNLPSDLLAKVDIASMSHGLEARSPFLDHKLMERVARVPGNQHLKGLRLKSLLKDIARPLLPDKLIKRPKMGFGVPIKQWFRHELKDYLGDHLLSQRARDRGLVDPAVVESMITDHARGRSDLHYQLWALLMMELWFETWIDGSDLPSRPASPVIA